MAYSQEVQEMFNRIRREVEAAVYSPPAWALDRVKEELVGTILKSAFNRTLAETIGKMIAEAFSQTIVLSVAQEFHRIAADEVAQGTRHLAYEVEALRRAIRRDQDQDEDLSCHRHESTLLRHGWPGHWTPQNSCFRLKRYLRPP